MQAAMRIGRQLARPARQAAAQVQQTRNMSSGHSIEESIGEMNKWRYAGPTRPMHRRRLEVDNQLWCLTGTRPFLRQQAQHATSPSLHNHPAGKPLAGTHAAAVACWSS